MFVQPLSHQRLHHAHLLVCPPEQALDLIAFFSRWLLCHAHHGDEPCGTCPACVAGSSHPDLVEVANTERGSLGVDDVRALRAALALRPTLERRRLVVVREAQRLTVAAQNALLKVLEEPPPETFFLLVVSRRTDLLTTVRSRCAWLRPWAGLALKEAPQLTEPPASFDEALQAAVGIDRATLEQAMVALEQLIRDALVLKHTGRAEQTLWPEQARELARRPLALERARKVCRTLRQNWIYNPNPQLAAEWLAAGVSHHA